MHDIICHFEQNFDNYLSISYYQLQFKESITIILQKKKDIREFTNSNNNRLISLVNKIKKNMKTAIAAQISYTTTTQNLKANFDQI